MSVNAPFNIEQFYRFLSQCKLMASKCTKCGKVHLPPRPICDACYSQEFKWQEVAGKGKLLTYTIIHVAPPAFQSMAPYAVGIVELESGLKLPGMISGTSEGQLRVGLDLVIDFNECNTGQTWPQWQRYCFKPV